MNEKMVIENLKSAKLHIYKIEELSPMCDCAAMLGSFAKSVLKIFLTLVVYKCIWCIFSVEKTISIACFDGQKIDHSKINLFLIAR